MLRLCIQSTSSKGKFIYQPFIQSSPPKCISACHNTITRHFAIKLKEDHDNKLERIYYGPLTPQIKGVKVFSLSSSIAGLLAQPIIIREASAIGSTSLLVALCSVVGFFTFITPLLLHIVTKKYVTEISYDPETSMYQATTITFFLARKQLDFKADDVQVPDVPGMFTTMNAKGKPLFIEARHFTDPSHYAKIMGYDKPMDFKLGDSENNESSK